MDLTKIKKMQQIITENDYAFSDEQMNEIHIGIEKGIDFLIYLNPKYNPEQMALIREGLIKGYDVSKYADVYLTYEQMKSIYNDIEYGMEKDLTIGTHIHDFKVTILKLPTCTECGLQKLSCACGESYEEEIPKKEHNFRSMKMLATCKVKGCTKHTCINCGYTYEDEETPLAKHTYSSETIAEPTCSKPGQIKYTCINCQHSSIENIPIINHKYEAKEIAPTCIELGYTLNTCIMCGQSYRSNEKDKIPHAFTNWERVKNPTCNSKGIDERICLRCKTKETKFINSLGHTYEIKRIEPTCKEPGKIIGVCTVCGYSYVENTIERTPHKYGDWEIVKNPTIYEKGIRIRKCIDCSFVQEEEIDSKKLTVESAQENALEKIYEKKKKNKIKVKKIISENEYKPIMAKYSKEEFDEYVSRIGFEFSPEETLLIEEGLRAGIDVKIYANDNYDFETMEELKAGVEHGLDLSKYTKDYDGQQINQIRLGIEHNIEFKKYLNPNFSATQMREIRLALEEGLDVTEMAALEGIPNLLSSTRLGKMFQPKYSSKKMYEMRMELSKKNKK